MFFYNSRLKTYYLLFFFTEIIYKLNFLIQNLKKFFFSLKIALKAINRLDDDNICKSFFILNIVSGKKPTLWYNYHKIKRFYSVYLKVDLYKDNFYIFLEYIRTFFLIFSIKKEIKYIYIIYPIYIYIKIKELYYSFNINNLYFLESPSLQIFINNLISNIDFSYFFCLQYKK